MALLQFNIDYYPMERRPRGRAVILNIINYKNPDNKREGATTDQDNVEKLWKELDFDVEIWGDYKTDKKVKTKEDLKQRIKAEVERLKGMESDAFIFFVMSHGIEDHILLHGPDGSNDDEPVNIEKDILKRFRGAGPNLVKKPRLFFIQACQGDKETVGVEANVQAVDPKIQSDAPQMRKDMAGEDRDEFRAYATGPGFKAYRHTDNGSFFVRNIVKVFAQYAHCKHLNELMTKVNNSVSNERDGEYLQVARFYSTCGHDLYFLPGYKKD